MSAAPRLIGRVSMGLTSPTTPSGFLVASAHVSPCTRFLRPDSGSIDFAGLYASEGGLTKIHHNRDIRAGNGGRRRHNVCRRSAAMGLRLRNAATSGSHAPVWATRIRLRVPFPAPRRNTRVLRSPCNCFGPAHWFPAEHPQMPPVVARGKQPEAWACGLCHYPNGKGRAENAGISGSTEHS